MFCKFQPHPETLGRFVCSRCKTPSSRNITYGPDGPPPRHCPKPVDIAPLITRLAQETGREDILLNDPTPYVRDLLAWQAGIPADPEGRNEPAEPFAIRPRDDYEFIVHTLCPECPAKQRYQPETGRCGPHGPVIAVLAHMETAGCRLRKCEVRW